MTDDLAYRSVESLDRADLRLPDSLLSCRSEPEAVRCTIGWGRNSAWQDVYPHRSIPCGINLPDSPVFWNYPGRVAHGTHPHRLPASGTSCQWWANCRNPGDCRSSLGGSIDRVICRRGIHSSRHGQCRGRSGRSCGYGCSRGSGGDCGLGVCRARASGSEHKKADKSCQDPD